MTATLARTNDASLSNHAVVSPDAWIAQRRTLLAHEKELTHLRDQIARERRALPWVRRDKDDVFDTADGPRRLSELFQGRRQLLVQHFMLGPGWEQGCKSCSFMADHLDGISVHLAHRDIALLAVSRAPLAEILRFQRRMGWKFPWVSSHGNDFDRDFHVSFTREELERGEVFYNYQPTTFPSDEAPGISVFFRDDAGQVFHTYSTFGRGVEAMIGAYSLMDLTPKGRDEDPRHPMDWIRHHDRYDAVAPSAVGGGCCGGQAA